MKAIFAQFIVACVAVLMVATNSVSFAADSGEPAGNPKLQHALQDLVAGPGKSITQAMLPGWGKQHGLTIRDNKVFVEFYLRDTSMLAADAMTAYGISRDSYFGRLDRLVQALVPIQQLDRMAARADVDWVQPPIPPHALVTSQGVAKSGADKYQTHSPAYTGAGVKVAVIDIGFQGYQAKLGSELPATVTAISFRGDNDITGNGEVHGTACAEVVHDMAPGAELFLMNAGTVVELSNAVTYCQSHGVKIITHSVGWFNQSFYDGTGYVCQVVANAHAQGIAWCAASGNAAQCHWDGTFSDPNNNGWENFSGTDEDINITLTVGTPLQLNLTWDQWPNAGSDYDLYLYKDGSNTAVASSTNTQNGTQPPSESIQYDPPSTGLYHVKIKKKFGVGTRLSLFTYDIDFNEYNVTAHSLADPAPSSVACTVGATHWSNDALESFSSCGPTMDGRVKPDMTGPDGTNSSVYGGPFYGTSAATPHVAGAMALLLSQDGTLTPDALKNTLMSNAVDLGDPGPDDLYGSGRLLLPDVNASAAPTLTSTATANTWTKAHYITMSWVMKHGSWSVATKYAYLWDHSATTDPSSTTQTAALSLTQSLADGRGWYFHVYAIDGTTISPTAHFGPVNIDSTLPTKPVATGFVPVVGVWTKRRLLSGSWSSSDATSGLVGYWNIVDNVATTTITTGLALNRTSISSEKSDGTWYIHIASRDSAGLWSPTLHVGPFKMDSTAPTGSFTINDGASTTTSNKVDLKFTLTETVSGVATMQLSNDRSHWTPAQAYHTPVTAWDLTLFGGTGAAGSKTVYASVVDSAGNTSVVMSASITMSTSGVHDHEIPVAPKLSLYPDPVTDGGVLTVLTSDMPRGTVELVDALGRVVAVDVADHGKVMFNTRALPAGLYECRVRGAASGAQRVTVLR